MITVIVEFKLPQPITNIEAREIFLSTAPKYQGLPGLIRKYYFLVPDGTKAGGVYLWESRAAAERVYTPEWKAFVKSKYGNEPEIVYVDTPVLVDNEQGRIASL